MTGFFVFNACQALHRLDTGIEAAFMTSGLVLVDVTLGNGLVYNGYGSLIGSLSLFLVSRFNRGDHFLDKGTEGRALPSV